MDSSILEFTQKYEEDTRIKSIEPFPYLPITGTQYNTPSIIRIDIDIDNLDLKLRMLPCLIIVKW